jgi:two-component system chemotaxis response regulator CheB
VVVGSLGAFDSFQGLLASLPVGFPAAVVFDLHRSDVHHVTEKFLRRRSRLPVVLARDGLAVEPSRVYLAPHDRQLIVSDERRFKVIEPGGALGHPFADALLASAARVLGTRLIAVVLSGRLEGGARGVREVKRHRGRVLVEDPRTAAAPSMPTAALASGCVDFALSPQLLGHALVALCTVVGAADLFQVGPKAAAP